MKSNGVAEDIQIDEHNLDKEWVKQPKLYFRYAGKLANAKRELDQAKSALDVGKAQVDFEVRNNPAEFGLAKFTEVAGSAAISRDLGIVDLNKNVLEAKHKVDVFQAAVTAFDHKRSALEGLVKLQLSDYYSSPKIPEGFKEEIESVKKDVARRKGVKRNNKSEES